VFLGDGSSKTQQKTFCKEIVSKKSCPKTVKKSKTDFSRFFYHVFGHDQKSRKNLTSPGTFLASEKPTTTCSQTADMGKAGLTPKRNPLHQLGV
jgi:hypothetical protein